MVFGLIIMFAVYIYAFVYVTKECVMRKPDEDPLARPMAAIEEDPASKEKTTFFLRLKKRRESLKNTS